MSYPMASTKTAYARVGVVLLWDIGFFEEMTHASKDARISWVIILFKDWELNKMPIFLRGVANRPLRNGTDMHAKEVVITL